MSTGSNPAGISDPGTTCPMSFRREFTGMLRFGALALLAAQSLALAGCGNSAATSGGLLGGSSPVATSAVSPAPNDPSSRALQVGATSARASYCSFNFDPAKLKANYLAFESGLGSTPDQMNKIERAYEYSRTSVGQAIAKQPDYCSEHQGKVIKADLARHLAGDYAPPPKPAEAQGGFLSGLMDGGSSKRPWTGTFNDQTGEIQ